MDQGTSQRAIHCAGHDRISALPEFLQGRTMVMLSVCMPADEAQANTLLQPMRDLGPKFDFLGVMPYTESAKVYNDPVDPLPVSGRGVLLKDLDEEGAQRMLEAIGTLAESPNLMVQLRHLGGAMADREEGSSPIGDRRGVKYVVYLLGVLMGPNIPDAIAHHAEGVFGALEAYNLSRGALNWLGEGDVSADHIRSVFSGAVHERLKQVRERYDARRAFCCFGVGID